MNRVEACLSFSSRVLAGTSTDWSVGFILFDMKLSSTEFKMAVLYPATGWFIESCLVRLLDIGPVLTLETPSYEDLIIKCVDFSRLSTSLYSIASLDAALKLSGIDLVAESWLWLVWFKALLGAALRFFSSSTCGISRSSMATSEGLAKEFLFAVLIFL